MSRASLTREAIDPARVLGMVQLTSHGATALFLGTVRNHADGRAVEGLEYTAYDSMAAEELERVLADAEDMYPGTVLAAEHRVGMLGLGDISVAVAAGSAHRAEAFDAARWALDELKRRVPIWKREQYADGVREWVSPADAASLTGSRE